MRQTAPDAAPELITTVPLGESQQVVTLVADSTTVVFEFDLPDALEGDVLTTVLAEVAVHGVNAQGGYIDQQGGSTVSIPYYDAAA